MKAVARPPTWAAKVQALELVRNGATVAEAMRAVGRAEKTWGSWRLNDPEFARLADEALEERADRQLDVRMDECRAQDLLAEPPAKTHTLPTPTEPPALGAPRPAQAAAPPVRCPLSDCGGPIVATRRGSLLCLSCRREVPA